MAIRDVCGEACPEDPDTRCSLPTHLYGEHCARGWDQVTLNPKIKVWPGAERPAGAEKSSPKRAQEIAEKIRRVEPSRRVARSTDPWTSWAAAAATTTVELRGDQEEVLSYFRQHGDFTDEELVNYAEQHGSRQGPSGLRTRRDELTRLHGLIVDTGRTRPTAHNRQAKVWALHRPGESSQ